MGKRKTAETQRGEKGSLDLEKVIGFLFLDDVDDLNNGKEEGDFVGFPNMDFVIDDDYLNVDERKRSKEKRSKRKIISKVTGRCMVLTDRQGNRLWAILWQ